MPIKQDIINFSPDKIRAIKLKQVIKYKIAAIVRFSYKNPSIETETFALLKDFLNLDYDKIGNQIFDEYEVILNRLSAFNF
jgi:hypothetical protein